jgi:hypothetical protein
VDADSPAADDERPPSPAESLRLIKDQQDEAARQLTADPLLFYGAWGVAWLIGFGALFLHYGLSGESYALSKGVAFTVFAGSLIMATATTSYASWRFGGQVRGVSRERATIYGWSWFAAYLGVGAIGGRFSQYVPEPEISLLWSGLSILTVGLLFMAGAALWRQWSMFFLGLWIHVVNVVGLAAGPGWHPLLAAVAGGGAFLLAGVVLRWHRRRHA